MLWRKSAKGNFFAVINGSCAIVGEKVCGSKSWWWVSIDGEFLVVTFRTADQAMEAAADFLAEDDDDDCEED